MKTETNLTSFYCSASWHIENGLAFRIYELAYMLTHPKGKLVTTFRASAPQLADYFRYRERSIYTALEDLTNLGFFVLIERGFFESNIYGVISHSEWAKTNLNRCAEKLEYSYSAEGDPLGVDLYALSNGRVKFIPFQIKTIREIGFTEDEIKTYFQSFLSSIAGEKHKTRKSIPGRFIMYLRKQRAERFPRPPETTEGLRGRAKQLREKRIALLTACEAQAVAV